MGARAAAHRLPLYLPIDPYPWTLLSSPVGGRPPLRRPAAAQPSLWNNANPWPHSQGVAVRGLQCGRSADPSSPQVQAEC